MSENKKERKYYLPEQKVLILRKLLENNVTISQIAEKYNVHVNDIYNWKKKLIEGAKDIFQTKAAVHKQTSLEQKKIQKLEPKLRDRDETIAILLKENIGIKKV